MGKKHLVTHKKSVSRKQYRLQPFALPSATAHTSNIPMFNQHAVRLRSVFCLLLRLLYQEPMHLFLPLAVYGTSVLVAATLAKKFRPSVAVLPCCTDAYADYVDAKCPDGVTVTW